MILGWDSNIARDEESELFTDCHSIWARWKNLFSHLFNVDGISYVRQRGICTAEPLVHDLCALELEKATEELKRHKSPETDP